MLLVGSSTLDYTLSANLHHNIMFWLDEGLVEAGFYNNIQGYYNSSSDLRVLSQYDNSTYQFGVERLIWQSGVSTVNGDISRFSGLYVEGNYYPNDSSYYNVDYHNGLVTFNDSTWNTIISTYGSSPAVTVSSYYAKSFYVVYNNDSTIYNTIGLISNDWGAGTLDHYGFSNPIICGGIKATTLEPYEMGGTKLTKLNYSILVLTQDAYTRDRVADLITKQKYAMPPSFIWSGLYDGNGYLLYDTTYQVIDRATRWRKWWFDDIRAVIFEDKIYAAEFDIDISIIGIE